MHSSHVLVWFIVGCGLGGIAGWACALRDEQRWWRMVRRALVAELRAARGPVPAGERGWS